MNVGHSDPFWRLLDRWTSNFWIVCHCHPAFDLKMNVGHSDPCFHGPVILHLTLKTVGKINIKLLDNVSLSPNLWPQNECRSQWLIFLGPVILPSIFKTIWCMNIILWDYESVWPNNWPKNKCSHCDVYFMVQWFCLISWLFDVWTSYFGIMSQNDCMASK